MKTNIDTATTEMDTCVAKTGVRLDTVTASRCQTDLCASVSKDTTDPTASNVRNFSFHAPSPRAYLGEGLAPAPVLGGEFFVLIFF